MNGKKLVVIFLGALFLLLGFVFWIGMTGGSQHVPGSPSPFAARPQGHTDHAGHDPMPSAPPVDKAAPGALLDAGPIGATAHDKATRDEVRRRILLAWSEADDAGAEGPSAGDIDRRPMPERDGGIDPSYIQEVIRSDFAPLVVSCYEQLRARQDAGGTVELSFAIVGDEKIGGIVEDAEISPDAGMGDDEFQTCLRESMMTIAFRPPPRGGRVTVRYPFHLEH